MHPSLHNAANSDLSLPSSLITASSDPLHQKATSSDLSLQSVYIAARSNLSLPTVLIVASNELNTTSSGLSLHTAAALLRNSRAHRCPVFLLLEPHPCCNQRHLQPRSRSAATTDIAAALFFLHHHCCLLTQTSRLPSSDIYQPPEKSQPPRHCSITAADVTAAIFFLHHCCYPWLPSSTWRLHHRGPYIAAIRYLQPEDCSYTIQSISGDFHDFYQDRIMMLKDFLDDDLRSTDQDREKTEPLKWRNQNKRRIIWRSQQNIIPLTMKKGAPPWLSGTIALTTMMLLTPNRGQMFMIGADTSRVGIDITLMQDGPWHERGGSPEELKSMLTPDWALIILNHTKGQSPFQKKDWLLLKTNHMAAHAKKK
ncbi:hypothetical protein B296_00015350 [Ensete ventricosum]|uniref:Uncharacterized protein n=1 Tax=Ensete ventricosum TaxID=4639 RepID=A0A426Z8Q9_ENSVE|nr:hypothetical protein B296_00015350 [Ensete ventricosum]